MIKESVYLSRTSRDSRAGDTRKKADLRMRHIMLAVLVVVSAVFVMGCSKGATVPPQPLSDAELESRGKSFIDLVFGGKHAEAGKMLDAKTAAALPASEMKKIGETLESQVGAFEGTKGTRVASESGYKVVYVTCQFKSAAIDAKVVFDAAGLVSGLWFVPSQTPTADWIQPQYANIDAFTEVDFQVGSGKWSLPGTLTMPKGDGPFPAVVLVHGSGPNDRDETIGPNKPFKDLAWGLASKGIAVLRYEKRTRQYAMDMASVMDTFTVNDETVDDALEAVAQLRQFDGIDPDRVFVVGHSLGATMAPRIAALPTQQGKEAPSGLVMMAPLARSLPDVMVEQYEYIASVDGQVTEEETARVNQVKAEAAKVKDGNQKSGELVLGAPKTYWDDILAYDPVAIAKPLELPILVLQGERDYQVTMEDFTIWKRELQGAANVTLKSFPGLNHLFIYGEGKPSPEEYNVPSNVDSEVIDTIAEWVKGK